MSILIKWENGNLNILTGYQKTTAGLTATWEEIKIETALNLEDDDINADDLAQALNCGSYAILEVE